MSQPCKNCSNRAPQLGQGNCQRKHLLNVAQVLLKSPMLLESELKAITSQTGMANKTFNLHYESGKPGALKAAVNALCKDVEAAVRNGCEVGTAV